MSSSCLVDDKIFKMETRKCSCPRCDRTFEVWVKSKQTICSIECQEITTGQLAKSNCMNRNTKRKKNISFFQR